MSTTLTARGRRLPQGKTLVWSLDRDLTGTDARLRRRCAGKGSRAAGTGTRGRTGVIPSGDWRASGPAFSHAKFDVVVVGAGPGGEVAAGRLAQAGLDVAIVEAEKVGGECSFYACIPAMAMLRPGSLLAEVRRVPGAAEAVTGPLDVPTVLARRDELTGHQEDAGQVPWLTERGITLVRGWGRLAGEKGVAVGDAILEARQAVILAGGTRAALPDIDGLADARPWTNREATTAPAAPKSLVVIGGGVREQLRASLAEQGVDIRKGQSATAVRRQGDSVIVTLSDRSTQSCDSWAKPHRFFCPRGPVL
ncbi:FAD-dependent oxidoreductase [Micromonospora costi]|uniref:NAD(P)/FAD-dependent oxidoreductase n=1 Tax=Micromonospora costi TaxID=1530042 RepID=A0A3B0A4G9_9ACTN|nr:FAD-dependent oxidoreductase [Micromonospora costi]RKN55304.1 NAD(P)/FAD-dependent oxidoreductase [Micromonospora costi]